MRPFPEKLRGIFGDFDHLSTPEKIQDFLNALPFNHEEEGDTMCSPQVTLARGTAHCLEGALVAAAALWYHGQRPLLLDLESVHPDQSHVVALFKRDGLWGAISKTNHAVLRFRDPVFRTVRELALSYFNEYFLDSGQKTLHSFSARPFSLLGLSDSWLTDIEPLWHIEKALMRAKHASIAPSRTLQSTRRADPIEITAIGLIETKPKR